MEILSIYKKIWEVIVLVTQSTLILTYLVSCRFQGFPPLKSQRLLWEMMSSMHRLFLLIFMQLQQGDIFVLAGPHCTHTPGCDIFVLPEEP